MMTDRENMLGLLRREGYERMPVYFTMTPDLARRFGEYVDKTGCTVPEQGFFELPDTPQKYPKPRDFFRQFFDYELAEGTGFSAYGAASEPGSAACMHMRRKHYPMKNFTTLEELERYPYPEFERGVTDMQREAVAFAHENGQFAMGSLCCSIWETAWYTRGMEELMMDMLADEPMADYLLDRVTENTAIRAENLARAGADGLYFGDDIGMQSRILMSEDMYIRFLKPRLKKLIDTARNVNPDILIMYHSCGYIEPFIPHLLDCGVDILNPVQPESMDFDKLHAQYGNKLSFCGLLGTQTLMPFGTPEEIRAEVRTRLDQAGKQGGLLICPTHILEPEVPVENVIAYMDACLEYRP